MMDDGIFLSSCDVRNLPSDDLERDSLDGTPLLRHWIDFVAAFFLADS